MRITSVEMTAINILRNRGFVDDNMIYITEDCYYWLRNVEKGAAWEWAVNKSLMIWRSTREGRNRKAVGNSTT